MAKLDINVTGDEMIKAMNRLAEAMEVIVAKGEAISSVSNKENNNVGVSNPDLQNPTGSQNKESQNEEEQVSNKEEQLGHGKEQPTYEEVKVVLGNILKTGKEAEVKALISKYGGKKLSDVDSKNYPNLLKALGELT